MTAVTTPVSAAVATAVTGFVAMITSMIIMTVRLFASLAKELFLERRVCFPGKPPQCRSDAAEENKRRSQYGPRAQTKPARHHVTMVRPSSICTAKRGRRYRLRPERSSYRWTSRVGTVPPMMRFRM